MNTNNFLFFVTMHIHQSNVIFVPSPGFLKDDFMTFLNERALRTGDATLVGNKSKFVKVAASSGHKNAVEQVLASPEVRSQMADVKAVSEVRASLISIGTW